MRRCNHLGSLPLWTALAAGILALCPCAPGNAAVLATLYEATVAGDAADPQRAAEEALREVATRVTGRRGAGSDAALAGLYEGARQYVQTMRPAGSGQVTVVFDAAAVDAALLRAGQPLWSRERPATLVVLLLDRQGTGRALITDETDSDEKRAMERMAQWRGVPLVWPAAGAELAAHAAEAQDGRLEPLLEWARRSEADAVLVGRPAGSAQISWTAAGAAAAGPLGGAPADVVQTLADRYAASFATAAGAALVPTEVLVSGIGDFKAYGATLAYLGGLTNVRGVSVVEVAGDSVHFLVSYRGDASALQRTVTLGGKLLPDPASGAGTLRFHRPP